MTDKAPGKKFDSEKLRRSIEEAYEAETKNRYGSPSDPGKPEPPRKQDLSGVPAQTEAEKSSPAITRREDMLNLINERISSCRVRLVYLFFATILLIWFECAAAEDYLLPSLISLNTSPLNFIIAVSAVLLLCAVLCIKTVRSGAAALFLRRPNCDSLCFIAVVGAAVCDVYLLFNSSQFKSGSIMIYSSCAAVTLLFNQIGRWAEFKRVKRGILAVPENGSFFCVKKANVTAPSGEEALTLFSEDTGSLGDYLERAFSVTPADAVSKHYAPLLFLAAVIMAAANILLQHGAYAAVATFAATCCIGAPVLYLFGQTQPFLLLARRLGKKGAMLMNEQTAKTLSEADRAVVDAEMVFPSGTVLIHAIKTFNGFGIEKAILRAASLAAAAKSPLRHPLAGLIEQGSESPLEKVGKIDYLDELGLSAEVGGRAMLFGSRELMRLKGVEVPTREFEAKYVSEGRDVIYLSEDGRLCAFFVVGYYSDESVLSSLRRLERIGVSLLISSNDANITPSMIADLLGEDRSSARIADGRFMSRIARLQAESAPSGLFFSGGFSAYAEGILAGIKLRRTQVSMVWIQLLGAVLGIGAVAYCSLISGVSVLDPTVLLEYQGIWMLPPILFMILRRG